LRRQVSRFRYSYLGVAVSVLLGGWPEPVLAQQWPENEPGILLGTEHYVRIEETEGLKTPVFTVEARVRFNTADRAFMPILHEGMLDHRLQADGYSLKYERGALVCRLAQARGAADAVAADFEPVRGRWVHVACVFDGANLLLYVDGELSGVKEDLRPVYYEKNGLTVGRGFHSSFDSLGFFDGGIGELAIWEVVRGPDDIRRDAGAVLNGDEAGLGGYWLMKETGVDTVIPDKTGRGADARLVHMPMLPAQAPAAFSVPFRARLLEDNLQEIPLNAQWTECVDLTGRSCSQLCGERSMVCGKCVTSRNYPGWGAEAWSAGGSCHGEGAGQTNCDFVADADPNGRPGPRWKCCCATADNYRTRPVCHDSDDAGRGKGEGGIVPHDRKIFSGVAGGIQLKESAREPIGDHLCGLRVCGELKAWDRLYSNTGIYPWESGRTWGTRFDGQAFEETDYCLDDRTLIEHACANYVQSVSPVQRYEIKCPSFCRDGACERERHLE